MTRFRLFILLMLLSGLTSLSAHADSSSDKPPEHFVQLHEQSPSKGEHAMDAAMAFKKQKMFDQALVWFKKAIELNERNTEAFFQSALVLSWTGKLDEAISMIDRALAIDSRNADVMLLKARVMSWQDKTDETLDITEKIISLTPEYKDAYMLKGRILAWRQQYDEAQKAYEKARQLSPDDMQASKAIFDIEAFKGNYETATDGYRKLLTEHPDNTDLLNGLGKIFSWHGNDEEAISILKKSFDLDRTNTDTLQLLILTYRRVQRYDEGIELQKTVLETDPENFEATKDIALLYEESGRTEQALEWFCKARKINPESADIHAKIGILQINDMKIDEAIKSIEKATAIEHDNDVTHLITLGQLLSWKNKLQESVDIYKKTLERNPQNQEAHIGLGRTYFYQGRLELALEQMQKALELNPLNTEAAYEYSRIRRYFHPVFESGYNYSLYRDYEDGGYLNKTHRHESIHDLVWPVSSKLSTMIQYSHIDESRYREEDGGRDYRFEGEEYSLFIDKKIVQCIWLKAKAIAGKYSMDSSRYTLRDDSFISGFGLIDFSCSRWHANILYAREPIYPVLWGDYCYIKYLDSYGGALRYEITSLFSVFASYYYKDYYGVYTQDEYTSGLSLLLPWFRKLELEYYFEYITNPDDRLHTGKINYRERIGRLSLLLSYALESSSLFDELTQEARGLFYLNISKHLDFDVDLSYSEELKTSQDVEAKIKVYLSYRF